VQEGRNPAPELAVTKVDALLELWRTRMLRPVFWTAALFSTLTVSLFAGQLWRQGPLGPAAWAAGLLLVLWYATLGNWHAVRLRIGLTLAAMYGASVLLLCTHGLGAGGFLSTFGFVAMTAVLRGRRAALLAVGLALATLALGAAGFVSGLLRVDDPALLDPTNPWNWLRITVFGAGIVAGVGGTGMLLLGELERALEQHGELVRRLSREAEEREEAMKALASAQERLVHAHKLEAVGLLSGGVAHDFNNTLTVILSYGELLRSRLGADRPLADLADQIVQAAEQGGELTKQLLTFSRRQIVKPRVLDVQQVLKASERAITRLVPRSVRVVRPEHHEPLLLNIDATQLQQAVLNLALNARDAMPEGGELRIEAEALSLKERGPLPILPGHYVVVRVRDDGVGMSEELQAKIFEPFFTTKEPGLGTGLGLSNVREAVEAAGGHLSVESQPGKGATFSLFFPRVQARASGVSERKPGPERAQATLLVVDDEPQIREVIQTMLSESGYDALTADTARAALAIVKERPVDLLCTDLVMPDMSGAKLLDEVRKVQPGLPVVVCSAYGTDEMLSKRIAHGDVVFLAKPFTRKDLLEAVERALGRRSESSPSIAG
jgi:signal transduction histidine kinase/CheY-like chemotaxis protein